MNTASLDLLLLRQSNAKAELGESPVWDPVMSHVWWVDIDGRKLLRADPASGRVETWDTPEIPGFVVLMASGRPALGMQTGIFAFDPAGARFERLLAFDREGHRFNDATVDPNGRLWVSTMALDAKPGAASILTVEDGLALNPVISGLTIPNGLAVDFDRGRLFYSDSHPDVQSIWVRSVEQGSSALGEATLFATTHALKGRPDGAALDAHGFYWIAGVDGSGLYIFDHRGLLETEISLPFPAPTKICFTGERAIAITSKGFGEDGGYLALADLPESFAPGVTQPFWAVRT